MTLEVRAIPGDSLGSGSGGRYRRSRPEFITIAGVGILLLGAAAAVSPGLDPASGAAALGVLMVAAGLLEMFAGELRHETTALAMLTGFATVAAGALLLFNRESGLLPNAIVIAAWLVTRTVILLLTSRLAHGPLRKFLAIAAATDFVLAATLVVGLSVSTLAVTIFGPTPQLLASYGIFLALSFAVTGALLLEAASCERGSVSTLSTARAQLVPSPLLLVPAKVAETPLVAGMGRKQTLAERSTRRPYGVSVVAISVVDILLVLGGMAQGVVVSRQRIGCDPLIGEHVAQPVVWQAPPQRKRIEAGQPLHASVLPQAGEHSAKFCFQALTNEEPCGSRTAEVLSQWLASLDDVRIPSVSPESSRAPDDTPEQPTPMDT